MPEVCTLASLILVMPATNAVSKHSFSLLCHLKSYLRSTMTQNRLNNVMVLNIGNEFIQGSSHRQALFGSFLQTDLD